MTRAASTGGHCDRDLLFPLLPPHAQPRAPTPRALLPFLTRPPRGVTGPARPTALSPLRCRRANPARVRPSRRDGAGSRPLTNRAIWLEAADARWDAAATLAHVAVATHYGSAAVWQQWLDLEEMRGNVESLLRLRALASAAGVRLSG